MFLYEKKYAKKHKKMQKKISLVQGDITNRQKLFLNGYGTRNIKIIPFLQRAGFFPEGTADIIVEKDFK